MPTTEVKELPIEELKESLHLSSIQEKILITLEKKDHLCGIQIIEAIEEATELKDIINTNSLYPTLKRLEKKHYIDYKVQLTPNDKGKSNIKFYKITGVGRKMLENAQEIRRRIENYQIS